MWNVGLDEPQTGIKISGRNTNNLRYADDTTLMAESEEELKSLLMKVTEGSEKADLKLNILKTKIMASGLITSWQMMGEKWKQWQKLFSWAPKSLYGDCSHAPWKKSYDKPRQCIKNQRHLFAHKDLYSQSYGFFKSCVDVRIGS